jgi:glycosyltransferase involved in cell wall biosynthesis
MSAGNSPHGNKKIAVTDLVPVYNTSKFLPQCLDSLLAQSLDDMEILCLNDGSTDDSPQILQQYAARDARIRIINKENSGYGSTMNLGVAEARGEYIGITESDDFAHPKMFKTLYKYAAKYDCDIAKSNYLEFGYGKTKTLKPLDGFPYKKPIDTAQHPSLLLTDPIIWAAIYRRRMLLDEGIRMSETPGAAFQDTSFVTQAWIASNRAVLLRKAYLHYRVDNPASSVKSTKNIYAVCGEFDNSERFLKGYPEKFPHFIGYLQADRFNTYRWNYNRIAEEYHAEFAHRMHEELSRMQADGSLVQSCFTAENWAFSQEILQDVEGFIKRYPKGF